MSTFGYHAQRPQNRVIWDSRLVPICLLASGQTPEQTPIISSLASSGAQGCWRMAATFPQAETRCLISEAGSKGFPTKAGEERAFQLLEQGVRGLGGGDSEPELTWMWLLRRTSPHHSEHQRPYLHSAEIIVPTSQACRDDVYRVMISGSPDLCLTPFSCFFTFFPS